MSAQNYDDQARYEFDMVQAEVVAALKTMAAAGNSKETFNAHVTLAQAGRKLEPFLKGEFSEMASSMKQTVVNRLNEARHRYD
jgi:2'-5' RNA ligase